MNKIILITLAMFMLAAPKAESADIWLPTIICFEAQCITSADAEAKSKAWMEGHFFCPGPLCSERMAGNQRYLQFVLVRDVELCIERTYTADFTTNPQSLWWTFLGTPAYFPTYASASASFLSAGAYEGGSCDPEASEGYPDPWTWPDPPNSN